MRYLCAAAMARSCRDRRGCPASSGRPISTWLGRDPDLAQGRQPPLPGGLGPSWLVTGIKERYRPRPLVRLSRRWPRVSDAAHRPAPGPRVGPARPVYYDRGSIRSACAALSLALLLYAVWVEIGLWHDDPALRPMARRRSFCSVIHLALGLGLAAGIYLSSRAFWLYRSRLTIHTPDPFYLAGRARLRSADRPDVHGISSSFAGPAVCVLASCSLVRGRRLYSIARLSIYEANRQDVGALGRHHGFPARAGVHALVPPAAARRRDGPAVRGHAHAALLGAADGRWSRS